MRKKKSHMSFKKKKPIFLAKSINDNREDLLKEVTTEAIQF